MRSEDEIREKIAFADKQAEEQYECGNWADMEYWNSYVLALEWVLQEDNQ